MDFGFGSNDHVFVSGSAGDIGLDCAKAFLTAGCKVTLHYHNSKNSLKTLLEQYPDRTVAVQADCRDEVAVADAFKHSTQRLGPINIVIANHAIFEGQDVPLSDMSLQQWKNTIDVNLTGTFLLVREYLKQLKQHCSTLTADSLKRLNANVVIIGSTAGKFGEAYHADYSATKSALMYGFMRSLKNEIVKICPRGRVNCVAPGWVHTAMASESVAQGKHLKALQTMPLKKIATVEEVVFAVLVLSSQRSNHCSGTTIEVDGGMEGRVLNSLEELKSNASSS